MKILSIWRTSDFETKFAKKKDEWQKIGKINIEIVISIQQCTPLQNFSHFVDLQIMGPNLPQKNNDKK